MSSETIEGSDLYDQVVSGDNRELQLLVARGLFPVPLQDLVALQVILAGWDAEELAAAAREALSNLDPQVAANVVSEASDPHLMEFLGQVQEHPVVLEAIVRNREVSAEVLGRIAPRLPPELQEVLILRQDIIVNNAQILDRLEDNPALSSYAERRIYEFREHLVRTDEKPAAAAPAEEPVKEEDAEATEQEVEEAIAEALELPASGERDEVTGLSEAQVRSLPVPVRLKLARGAPRTLRSILIRDKNAVVAMSVVNGNALTESEIELIAANRSVAEEVLSLIAHNRQWSRKYNIVHALIRNPRTSVGLAVRLTPRLSIRDLRNLSRDRNVSEAVRNTASRLYRIKAL